MSFTPSHFLLKLIAHQDWLRVGIRNRLLRRFFRPEKIASYEFIIDFFGFTYKGNLNCYIDWVVYFFGAYEKQELFLLSDIVQNIHDPIFIDVGANVGQHSLYMSKYCREVHAFEPYKRVSRLLEEKIRLNKVQNITIHKLGLNDNDAELQFFEPEAHNTGTGSFLLDQASKSKSSLMLRVVNGDAYLESLKLPKIDLIKIDVEGFERNVICGLSNSLYRFRPIVVMEFSESTQRVFKDLNALMLAFPPNYEIRQIVYDQAAFIFFNRSKYQLLPFNFEKSIGDLILYPEEKHILGT